MNLKKRTKISQYKITRTLIWSFQIKTWTACQEKNGLCLGLPLLPGRSDGKKLSVASKMCLVPMSLTSCIFWRGIFRETHATFNLGVSLVGLCLTRHSQSEYFLHAKQTIVSPSSRLDCYKCCLWSCYDNCEGHGKEFITGLFIHQQNT